MKKGIVLWCGSIITYLPAALILGAFMGIIQFESNERLIHSEKMGLLATLWILGMVLCLVDWLLREGDSIYGLVAQRFYSLRPRKELLSTIFGILSVVSYTVAILLQPFPIWEFAVPQMLLGFVNDQALIGRNFYPPGTLFLISTALFLVYQIIFELISLTRFTIVKLGQLLMK
jgi:hypothetical protein